VLKAAVFPVGCRENLNLSSRRQSKPSSTNCEVSQVPLCDFRRSTGLLCGKVCSNRAENRQKRRNRAFRPDFTACRIKGVSGGFMCLLVAGKLNVLSKKMKI